MVNWLIINSTSRLARLIWRLRTSSQVFIPSLRRKTNSFANLSERERNQVATLARTANKLQALSSIWAMSKFHYFNKLSLNLTSRRKSLSRYCSNSNNIQTIIQRQTKFRFSTSNFIDPYHNRNHSLIKPSPSPDMPVRK